MKRRRIFSIKHIFICILCIAAFSAAVIFVFYSLQKSLNKEFDGLIVSNLNAVTRGQAQQADALVQDVKNTLVGITVMINTTALSPEDGWLQEYLNELSLQNDMYDIKFLNKETLLQHNGSDDDQAILDILLNGEGVVSDIRVSERLGSQSVFAIAEPVVKNGEVVGALRMRLQARGLTRTPGNSALFERLSTLIIKGNGDIAFSDAADYPSTGNLFTSMQNNGISAETVQKITRMFGGDGTKTMQFSGKGNGYFISVDKLDYNDWYLVNFVRSRDVLIQSASIIKSVVGTGIMLIILTIALSGVIIYLILRQKKRLSLEKERYAVLSQFSDTVLFEYDCETDTLEFTSNAKELLSLENLKINHISASNHEFSLLMPDDKGIIQQIFHTAPENEETAMQYKEARLKSKDGAYCWFGCQYKYVFTASGKPSRVIGKIVDITDQRGREQSLINQAQKDVLTDLYNKSGEQMIDDALQAKPCGLFFMIDIDNFKNINDTCGHASGDEYLFKIGVLLKDIFHMEGDITARIGGDEFVGFIPVLTLKETAAHIAEKIMKGIGGIHLENMPEYNISASVGIATAPEDGKSYAELYEAADNAMYRVKQNIKGNYAFYREELGSYENP